jgi:2-oxoglutarate ferredoxin oxidoreductase subunit alpha
MAMGASFAGTVAVTGSSGPGISLKMESIGWGVMAEMPLVVVNIQRGGPSTGLPTQVEQSDLNLAIYGAHGDAPRVVLAPGNVEDCFYTAIEAVNIARAYNVPVFLLSDQAIATRIEAFDEPDLEKLCQDLTPNFSPVPEYKPYDLSTTNGVNRRVVPGTPIQNGKYPVVTGLEHDEYGHPTGSPKLHAQMTAKRRKKLQAFAATLPKPALYGPPEGNVLLVGWGSTQGPIREAVDRARAAGNPLPLGLEEIFSGFNMIQVVEMNDEGLYGYGQLGGVLRARFCDPRIRGINKTDGLTWKVKEILERASADVATGMRKL